MIRLRHMNFKIFTILVISFCTIGCKGQNDQNGQFKDAKNQELIIQKYLKNGAWNHHYLTKEWEEWINKGLQEDSTIAYLWQQKALPYWKQKKYKLAISYYDRAVKLDREKWLSRLAFLKCIFAKDYESALSDLNAYLNEFGSTYEQDHSLEFYKGICYLQMNKYEDAVNVLREDIEKQEKESGEAWVHYLDRFYLGIAYYETDNYAMAISEFDKILKVYPNFSDAQFYKSVCLKYIGKMEEAKALMMVGKSNYKNGYTFNEDSNKYENYPYQLTWQWDVSTAILE